MTLAIYPFSPTVGHLQLGQFFWCVIANCASMYVLGRISRCTCVRVSLGYAARNGIAEWEGMLFFNFTNCQMALQSDYINSTSQIFLFFSFSHLLSPHITTSQQFSPKTLLESQVSPTKLSSRPSPHPTPLPFQLLQKPRNWCGKAQVRARKKLCQAEPRDPCIVGLWGRMGEILESAYVNHVY